MTTTRHRHSLHCILPPHVLRSIVERGNPGQRARAMRTLTTDQTLRALRAAQPARRVAAGPALAPGVEGQKRRTVNDAHGQELLPGDPVRCEGALATGDVTVDEAYDGLGATYDFFLEAWDRNSIDDEGMPLDATVHFGREYNNAFWNGQQMVFGDGDGDIFNRFTIALDIIGHELGHGVTEDEGPLIYFFQAGALNESMSDVFGSLVKQYALKQTADQADWLIGAGLLASGIQGVALRSMSAPGTAFDDPLLGRDPQPAHMTDYVQTFEDNGGVHINSGIPNRAFHLAATGIGGFAWERTGRIWYDTLRDPRLRPNTGFRRFARLTVSNAARLYGATSTEARAVRDAWAEVGIRVS
jgi:Zn-dependent metalloprotease